MPAPKNNLNKQTSNKRKMTNSTTITTVTTENSSSRRQYVIGGNWKCNGTKEKVKEWVKMLTSLSFDETKVQVIVAPIAMHLSCVMQALETDKVNVIGKIEVAAQNVSQHSEGAYTGEISAAQLVDHGLKWTLVGHSERRCLFHETNEESAIKAKMALDAGLNVLFCIGENLSEREEGKTMDIVSAQMQALKDKVEDKQNVWTKIVVAYEPVWAIGTGKVATPEQAQEVHAFLRNWVSKSVGENVASSLRIIYGGSVKASNCNELIGLPDVDGFLVGGASLKPEFANIVACANIVTSAKL